MTQPIMRSGHLDADGLRLHYVSCGPEDAEPVLFLHGGGLTAYTWVPLFGHLGGRYRCIAPDLRGHGDSAWAPDGHYLLPDYVRDVRALTAELGIDGCSVVGMSLGGHVALAAAVDGLPFRSLTLVDVGPSVSRSGGAGIRTFTRTHSYPSFDAAVEAAIRFNPYRSREALVESLSRNMVEREDRSWAWKWDPRRYGDLDVRHRQGEMLWPAIPTLNLPVLVVRGGESHVFPQSEAERLAAALPDARLVVVPDAGHTVQGDNPAALAAALDEFLIGVPAREGRS
ncbi:alpha/beta fold hydrolase [Dactylosporangium sp. CA-092794]|uniref:alpha/beta fold hydrolase n=1 Tax=Dactylosporangium sp. CA-092794 TaxID=3239929 RepID=UPI003D8B9035